MADPQEIINFRISEAAQRRAEELLEKNSSNRLTPEERLELAQMLHFDRLMSVLKATALARVGRGSESHP